MRIEIAEIDGAQKGNILEAQESHFLDLKSIDVKPAKLSKAVSAFANASGGDIYIGIDEYDDNGRKSRKWRGFSDQESANAHMQILSQIFPFGQYYSCTFLRSLNEQGLVLQIVIHKSREIIKATDNIVYVRHSAQSLPVNTEEGLSRLRLDKGIQSFEKETVSVAHELISESQIMRDFIRHVIPSAEAGIWLEKQLLIQNRKPTVAGILLFADEPQAILPKRCGVKIYRYRTKNEGTRETLVFDPITIEGHLYEQVKRAVDETTRIVQEIPKMGTSGLESIQYPEETLHEILTNALLHRDYSIASDVHVRIFDNRIEIESPGRLPGHITPENILREQFARNGTIVRIINKFPNPPNKDVGEGLNTAFLAMSKLRLQPPLIKEGENSVVVYIRHEPLASIDSSIMKYLELNDEVTNREVRKITGIESEGAVKAAFYRLRDKGLIELVPNRSQRGPGAAWRRVKDRPGEIVVERKKNEHLISPDTLVLGYLQSHNEINSRIARNITGILTKDLMKAIFRRLRDQGLIELIPGRPQRGINAAWRIVESKK